MVDDVLPQIISHAIGIPRRGIQQTLDTLRPGLTDRFCQLPAVLALDPIEQANKIATEPLAHLDASETVSDPLKHVVQCFRPTADRDQTRCLFITFHHDAAPLSCCQGKRSARIRMCRCRDTAARCH